MAGGGRAAAEREVGAKVVAAKAAELVGAKVAVTTAATGEATVVRVRKAGARASHSRPVPRCAGIEAMSKNEQAVQMRRTGALNIEASECLVWVCHGGSIPCGTVRVWRLIEPPLR